MKRYLRCFLGLICFTWGMHLLCPNTAFSEICEKWVAQAVSVQGTVEVKKAGESQWQPVALNDTFCSDDVIQTHSNSRASFALSNDSTLRINHNSNFIFEAPKEGKTFFIKLLKGAAHIFSRTPRALQVQTPHTSAGVRGTEFLVTVEENKTLVTVYEGAVLAENSAGSLNLNSGQSAVTEKGRAPVLIVLAYPRDAVSWALHYPPVIFTPTQEIVEDFGDPRFLIQRASQFLHLGQLESAKSDIAMVLIQDPGNIEALALQTIIAVVQNDKDKALTLGRKSVEANPNSATALVALSYAQQAVFDLEGARSSLEASVEADPQNGLAWARLAELWSSSGRLDKSLDAAQKAVAIAPYLSRTQTVLGFAYLTQVKTSEARDAFSKALELDQADPLPHLGLGLAIIREGDLKEGGREIEIAASLDPNNSLIRSYLGKTYYEKKRSNLDGREYATAKELDPNDPTPWFYDAIRKQTINRPVEALHDMERAIELNDNQAVYRSRLMLDSDLAARSSSLARIYNNLGFQQRGLVEGWKSVNSDPTNFSAHRFLADTYSVLPRHEIARVSELLQSQLLQPINITPIQPRLAERNLFLIGSQGPSAAGFNSYNPLFNRNGATVQVSGLGGENSTWGGEGVVSAIYNKLSLSAGYSGFGSDGYRENNDQRIDIANFFAQYQVNYKTSVQAEYRYRKDERGDLAQWFLSDILFPYERNEDKSNSFRIGFHHNFVPGSDLIGNFQYLDGDRSFHDQEPDPDFIIPISNYDLQGDDSASGSELSYLFKSEHLNVVTGAGYFDIDAEDRISFALDFGTPPLDVLFQENIDADTTHSNLYMYSYLKPLDNLTLTIGGSGDFFEADDELVKDKNQFNPKLGISWDLESGTSMRIAAFRVLKRTLITNQTLEPTQVAGFNQFFDELNATDYWRYGGAIDQKFTANIYGGIEYTYRDLTVPYAGFSAAESDWKENLWRAYLFWTPCKWASLTAEYRYEDIERDEEYAQGSTDAKTHYLPLGINLFHPLGLIASMKGTYINQDGNFERKDNFRLFEDGDDNFWLVDAALSYRLPDRYGLITVGVNNLFDQEFDYFDSDLDNSQIEPDRYFFARITLALP